MLKQKFVYALIVAAMAFMTTPALARFGGSSFHSSFHSSYHSSYSRPSSSSFSHSSSSYSRPSSSSFSHSSSSYSRPSSSSFSRPSTTSTTRSYGGSHTSQTPFERHLARGHSAQALSAYRAQQNHFKSPPFHQPVNRAAARHTYVWRTYGSRWHSANQYYASRNLSISRLPPPYHTYWTTPPSYVLQARPSYDGYSGIFLGSLLGIGAGIAINSAYADWAYSHYNNPGYIAWHQDMLREAQTDAILQQRIAALDAQVALLKAQNAPMNPNALPPGVTPSMVVAPETVMIATSHPTGHPMLRFLMFAAIAVFLLWFLWKILNLVR